jgi:hypothetical protein
MEDKIMTKEEIEIRKEKAEEKAEEKNNILADLLLARHYLETTCFNLKQEKCPVLNAAINKLKIETADMIFDGYTDGLSITSNAVDFFKPSLN